MFIVAGIRAEAPAFEPELDELARILYRQHPQQDLVDQGKDGSVGADPERERENGR